VAVLGLALAQPAAPVSAPAPVAPAEVSLQTATDWFIPENDPSAAVVYPGPVRVADEMLAHAWGLAKITTARSQAGSDFRLEYGGVIFRGHRQATIDGFMQILRRISVDLPDVRQLGLPPEVQELLCHRGLGENGGLVLVCGAPGNGKSTTCAAVLMERVRRHGAFCLTVEDPPEFQLHGDHVDRNGRAGKVVQVPARSRHFADDLRDALRCYPANSRGAMLLVGEVRDADTAAQLLQAAVNGQLVFTTLHAGDPVAALERVLTLAKDSLGNDAARALLAHSLRAVLRQRLVGGRLQATALFSMAPDSPVAARIKSGNLQMLSSEIQQQASYLTTGTLLTRMTGMPGAPPQGPVSRG